MRRIARIREKERLGQYARKMGMTIEEARNEPAGDVDFAHLIWRLDGAHAKLKAEEK